MLEIPNLLARADSLIQSKSEELDLQDSIPVGNLPSELDSISDLEKRLLMELTIDYWNDGTYRSIGHYQELFPVLNMEVVLSNLAERLDTNGLPQFDTSDKLGRDEPNPEFVVACNIVCDFNDKRGLASKLKDINRTTRHWNAWLNKKPNRDYLASRMDRVWDDNVEINAKLGVARLIESGDLQAIRFYYEITHKYRPQDTNVMNMQLILVTLMEVLAKHVSTEILGKIADEIDRRDILPALTIGEPIAS